MIRNIIKGPDSRLSKPSQEFTFTPAEMDILTDLVETRNFHEAYGLAAIQIGEPVRAICIRGYEPMMNAEVIVASDLKDIADEACLSYPWLKPTPIARPVSGIVRWQDPTQAWCEVKISGFAFRAICHEIDHTNGITIDQLRRKQ